MRREGEGKAYARVPRAPMVAVAVAMAMEPNVVHLEVPALRATVSGARVSAKDHVAKSSIEVSFAEKVKHRSWTIVMKLTEATI